MFYVTILACALIGGLTHGPLGILAGAVIGFLIAKIDGKIATIGQTNEAFPFSRVVERLAILLGLFALYSFMK